MGLKKYIAGGAGRTIEEEARLRHTLHSRATVALRGLSDDPGSDLAALLRYPGPIEPEILVAIADAFDGRSKTLIVTAKSLQHHAVLKKYRVRIERINVGRQALELQKDIGRDTAIDQIARKVGKSVKSIEQHVAEVRKLDAWVKEVRSASDKYHAIDIVELERIYLLSDAAGTDPMPLLMEPVLRKAVSLVNDALAPNHGSK